MRGELGADPVRRGRQASARGARVLSRPSPAGRAGPPGRAGLPRTPRWAAPVLFLLLLAAFAVGIWGSYREAFPGKGLYRITGIFEDRWGDTMILVKHDAVPGLMAEMSNMAFI